MGNRTKTPTEIISYLTIAVSLASLSGLALGHATLQSMQARLSASPPVDPVERYALGQNAYKTSNAALKSVPAQPAEYADASYEIGTYEKGARVLMPQEPARKIERLRLEQLQDWNKENFGDPDREDKGTDYAKMELDDYAPIDVGAVIDAPERPVLIQVATRSSGL